MADVNDVRREIRYLNEEVERLRDRIEQLELLGLIVKDKLSIELEEEE